MRILKRAGSGLFVGAAAAFAIGLGATTALAATTLHVTVTGGGSYSATSTHTVLTDKGISTTCPSAKVTGSVPNGSHTGTSPVKVGTDATLKFSNCTSPFGPVSIGVSKLPYSVKVDSVTNSSGQTDGMITGVNNSVAIGSPVLCKFTVTGSAPGVYSNSKHTLTLEPSSKLPIKPLNTATLTIHNPSSGCAGVVSDGDHPTFTATFKVSRAIVIKSKL